MHNAWQLTGKVAIVTGASRGIGYSIAEALVGAGVNVVLSSRKQDALDAAAAAINEKVGDDSIEAVGIAAHNGQKDALFALVEQTVDRYGGVDVIVNNAATNPHFGPILEAEDSMWQKTLDVNLMGNVWLTQAAVPHLRERGGGSIINVASIVGLRPGHMQGIYSVTKAAIISLTQTLAMELGGDNIRVNAIAPGLIQTRFAQVIWENDTLRQDIEGRTPLGRIGQPQDIAAMALWLASPLSAFATGETFVVDGGLTLGSL